MSTATIQLTDEQEAASAMILMSWLYTGITRAMERIIVTPYPPGYREPAKLSF